MIRPDPQNYREMSVPFFGPEAANLALEAFYDDVRAARQKHRIADVLTVVSVNVIYDEGGEGAALSHSHNGDPMKAESMAAYVFGREQADRKAWLNKLVAGTNTRRSGEGK